MSDPATGLIATVTGVFSAALTGILLMFNLGRKTQAIENKADEAIRAANAANESLEKAINRFDNTVRDMHQDLKADMREVKGVGKAAHLRIDALYQERK